MGDLTYSTDQADVDQETALRAAAVVRRHVPEVAGRLELLSMLGLTGPSRRRPGRRGRGNGDSGGAE